MHTHFLKQFNFKSFITFLFSLILVGCASAPTPEKLRLAEERKGQVKLLQASLSGKLFLEECGWTRGVLESNRCRESYIIDKLHSDAKEFCVFYESSVSNFNRYLGNQGYATGAGSMEITCTGIPPEKK